MRLKSIILSCVILGCIFSSIAQSTFILRNGEAGINAPVLDAEGTRLSGTNYGVELWGGVTSSFLSPTLNVSSAQRVFVPFLTGMGAGYFTSSAALGVVGSFGGQSVWVQVRAWDTRLGATYEQVVPLGLGGYGESSLLNLIGGDPAASPPVGPHYLFGLQSFSLRPIPEPSVWQLSFLGLPVMLLLRRKGRWLGRRG